MDTKSMNLLMRVGAVATVLSLAACANKPDQMAGANSGAPAVTAFSTALCETATAAVAGVFSGLAQAASESTVATAPTRISRFIDFVSILRLLC